MKILRIENFRKGLATNSSSTHSIIYKNKEDLFEDLNIFEEDYYGRCTETIAVSKKAKIKYILSTIYWNDSLVKLLALKYPEVEEYYPLIKEAVEARQAEDWEYDYADYFGCCARGCLTTENLEFDLEYLSSVIDNPELVIVGGSDEYDFYYDTVKNHKPYHGIPTFIPHQYQSGGFDTLVQKNGTYWVSLIKDDFNNTNKTQNYAKFRLSFGNHPLIPEYPELIDLKLTNKCNHNCPFCFMDSKMEEQHADPNNIKWLVSRIAKPTEFSIGGGNILLYPHLIDVLQFIHKQKHIVNITINEKDCKAILKNPQYKEALKYVHGIGISLINLNDVKSIKQFRETFHNKFITFHLIPELLGIEKCLRFKQTLANNEVWGDYLFLGYKTNGRGNKEINKLSKEDLDALFEKFSYFSTDTSFANTYLDYLKENFYIDKSITLNEGEFSMYIDGVTGFMYKSSYQLDKPYSIDYKDKDKPGINYKWGIEDVFNSIRKDNGLPIYSEYKEDKYYNQ